MLSQDSVEDDVSVNYCQLSSPGYKEEQLRREEVGLDLFSGNMEEFTIVSYTPHSGRTFVRRELYRNPSHVHFNDMINMQFEPNTSANFNITDSYFTAKQTGLYAFQSENVEMTIDGKWISNNDDQNYNMASVALVKKGQMIKFKIANGAKGKALTIFKIK